MKLITALLVSFLAVASANPVVDKAARDTVVPRMCEIVPFLSCQGGINQESQCENLGFTCQASGTPPIISDTTCAAQCVCEVPCP
ncbi:hypothetical protein C8R44DRAFT_889427 [Mycena epipterygia]|nr:hypothetical protein C8R44DRAFT_889427 [Mycena epipterygia]